MQLADIKIVISLNYHHSRNIQNAEEICIKSFIPFNCSWTLGAPLYNERTKLQENHRIHRRGFFFKFCPITLSFGSTIFER